MFQILATVKAGNQKYCSVFSADKISELEFLEENMKLDEYMIEAISEYTTEIFNDDDTRSRMGIACDEEIIFVGAEIVTEDDYDYIEI